MVADLNDKYELSYAGIPFCLDKSTLVRLVFPAKAGLHAPQQPPEKQQPLPDLMDEINRRIPFRYLNEFAPPRQHLKGNLSMLAQQHELSYPPIGVGDFFYPTNASRWACGRFLATSTMAKRMVAKAIPQGGPAAQKFKMKNVPEGAGDFGAALHTIETDLFMLPPRPLAEIGKEWDGLFLVTLVDERWYWQQAPATLKPYDTTTWSSLIQDALDALGIEAESTAVNSAYLQPQQDSQLWTTKENAAVLLDAMLTNVGKTFVRKLDGTYQLMDYTESAQQVIDNRGDAEKVILYAGGDIFYAGTKLAWSQRTSEGVSRQDGVGSLLNAPDLRRAVLPKEITVGFPYYINTNAPVPHFFNTRYRPKRPSCQYEDKPADQYYKTTTVTGNEDGQGTWFLSTTAKALIDDETGVGSPSNQAALDALAVKLSNDVINQLVGAALDEVYPGICNWEPEGINDILWRWTGKDRQASTRIARQEWNQIVREFQHAEGQPPMGVGGPSVAQSWHNWVPASGSDISSPIYNPASPAGEILSGNYTADFEKIDNFPTFNRWRGVIDKGLATEEKVLMEGTSGGNTGIGIVFRGIDGTNQVQHSSGASLEWIQDNFVYGPNSVLGEKMQFVFPGLWTSGGISQVVIKPQTQTVRCFTGSGALIRGITSYSGQVFSYDATKDSGQQLKGLEYVWLQNRNPNPPWPLHSGRWYDGQFAGHTASGSSGTTGPLYLVNDDGLGIKVRTFLNHSGCIPWSGGITSGYFAEPGFDLRVSGLASGWENGASLSIRSTDFNSSGNVTIWWTVSGSSMQTVRVDDISGTLVDGIIFYSGTAYQFDRIAASGDEWVSGVPVRVIHRNPNPHWPLYSGWFYDGQWVGNMSGCSGSTFLVTDEHWRLRTVRSGGSSPGVNSGYHGPQPKIDFVVSGAYASGQTSIDIRSHEFVDSGVVQVYFTVSGLQGGGAAAVGAKSVKVELPYYSGGATIPALANTRLSWSGVIYDTDTIFTAPGSYFIPKTSGKYSIKGHVALAYSGLADGQHMQVILTVNDISYEEQSWVAYSGRFTVHSSVCGDHLLTTSSRVSINVLNGLTSEPVAGYFMMHQFPAS